MTESSLDQLLKQIQEGGEKINPQPLLKRQFIPVHISNKTNTSTETDLEASRPANGVVRIMQWNLLAQGR